MADRFARLSPAAGPLPSPASNESHQRRHEVVTSLFGPDQTIHAFLVRPSLTKLYWCSTCGAYTSRA
eukprot:1545122-Amphidinium_carterae.1